MTERTRLRKTAARKLLAAYQDQGGQFKRGVQVAYKTNPKVRIGEVMTPPALRNPVTGVKLLSGGSIFLNHGKLAVWKDPKDAPAA